MGDLRERCALPYSPIHIVSRFQLAEPPAGQLRLASEATTNFTAGLLAAAAKLTPSTLFSTGGDELNTNCYAADEETQAALNATGQTLEQALNTFTQVTHKALLDEGKTPVVWEGASYGWCCV